MCLPRHQSGQCLRLIGQPESPGALDRLAVEEGTGLRPDRLHLTEEDVYIDRAESRDAAQGPAQFAGVLTRFVAKPPQIAAVVVEKEPRTAPSCVAVRSS